MTEHELYVTYKLLYQFITSERLMRLKVFPEGHPQRKRKIAACDDAIYALTVLKDFCKEHVEPSPRQGALLDAPAQTKKGGY